MVFRLHIQTNLLLLMSDEHTVATQSIPQQQMYCERDEIFLPIDKSGTKSKNQSRHKMMCL